MVSYGFVRTVVRQIEKCYYWNGYKGRRPTVRASDIPEIIKLSTPEKILLVEDLWDSIAEDESAVPVPKSHKQELDGRLGRYELTPGNLLSLEELRTRVERRKWHIPFDFFPMSREMPSVDMYGMKRDQLGSATISFGYFTPVPARFLEILCFTREFMANSGVIFSEDFHMLFTSLQEKTRLL
jgi:putative addiction module component (TIGR02574 family)